MTDKIRTRITCPTCEYSWRTKANDPEQAKCPACAGRHNAKPQPLPALIFKRKPEPVKRIDTRDRSRIYGRAEATSFVHGLGAWSAENFARAMAQRTDKEYIGYLKKLISVNKTRRGEVAAMENAAAWAVIGRLTGVVK